MSRASRYGDGRRKEGVVASADGPGARKPGVGDDAGGSFEHRPATVWEAFMQHGSAGESAPDPASAYKTRLGVWMFLVYCVVYAGFVLGNVVGEGELMSLIVFAGLNLATVYGVGLIVFALVLALIYNQLCSAKERALAERSAKEGESV